MSFGKHTIICYSWKYYLIFKNKKDIYYHVNSTGKSDEERGQKDQEKVGSVEPQPWNLRPYFIIFSRIIL